MEDNTRRVGSDSWFGRRRKCSRVGGRVGDGGAGKAGKRAVRMRSGKSRMSFCMQQPGLLNNVVTPDNTRGDLALP